MKTKTKIFLFAFGVLCFVSTHTLNAQVTIGAEKAPESYSLLELNTTTVKGGVQLPKLATSERNELLSSKSETQKLEAKGLTIFNTTTNCTDTWNGTTWISNCSSNVAPQITTQPRAFNWKETTGAGNMMGVNTAGTANLNSPTLKVVATGVGTLTYQWYEIPANQNAQPTTVSDGSDGTTASFTPALTALGMRRYFCRVTDGNKNVVDSNIAEVAVGCGAKTVQGGWLKFQCANLGATVTTIDAQKSTGSVTYSYSDASKTATPAEREAPVYGDLYQWGRITDGHEKRTSGTTATLATNNNATAPDGISTSFIKAPTYPFSWTSSKTGDLLWRNHKNTYDPCPSGWRVPSQYEWASIFNGISIAASSSATANTWSWYAGDTKGYEVKPDGLTTTLFLPAVGIRDNTNGELYYVGGSGYYWSATIYTAHSLYLYFNAATVHSAHVSNRANGLSVRCVSEF